MREPGWPSQRRTSVRNPAALVFALLLMAACGDAEPGPASQDPQSATATETSLARSVTSETTASDQTAAGHNAPPATEACEPLDEAASDVQRLIGVAAEVQRVDALDPSSSADESRVEAEVFATASAVFDGACERSVLDLCGRLKLECVVVVRDGREFDRSLEGFIGNVLIEVDSNSVRVVR